MHTAAFSYAGILSILYLKNKFNFPINVRDNFNATPLHFAVISKECKNVEMLIKLESDVNA